MTVQMTDPLAGCRSFGRRRRVSSLFDFAFELLVVFSNVLSQFSLHCSLQRKLVARHLETRSSTLLALGSCCAAATAVAVADEGCASEVSSGKSVSDQSAFHSHEPLLDQSVHQRTANNGKEP